MATTSIGSSGVTFPDSTVQATAALPFIKGQAFTSSGTFTIPTGVTALKVTVVGGGGNGSSGSQSGSNPITFGGNGGASGALAIKYLTGLTSGSTIGVTVGGVGGTSSIQSGTQSITTVSAAGNGGSATNGTINVSGGQANQSNNLAGAGYGNPGANSLFYGSGGNPGAYGSRSSGGAGGAGGGLSLIHI